MVKARDVRFSFELPIQKQVFGKGVLIHKMYSSLAIEKDDGKFGGKDGRVGEQKILDKKNYMKEAKREK